MNLRWSSFVVLLGLLSTLLALPMTTYAQAQGPGQGQGQGRTTAPGQNKGNTFDVTGTGASDKGPADFAGKFTVQNFRTENGQLIARGVINGKVTVAGVDTPVPDKEVDLPVQSINGHDLTSGAAQTDDEANDLAIAQAPSCGILNLVLGPLHLDLLGLVVDLNQVLLNITGQTGPGNLLGNLLCALTGILDNTPAGSLSGLLGAITNLLNGILAGLNL